MSNRPMTEMPSAWSLPKTNIPPRQSPTATSLRTVIFSERKNGAMSMTKTGLQLKTSAATLAGK